MDDLALARILHVLGVVLWIGGVAMVTTVILPATRRLASSGERIAFFESIERRFARQARVTTLIVGLSGLYLAHRLDAWDRFLEPRFWWMHGMVLVWVAFTLVLFVAEPLFLHRWFLTRAQAEPEATFALVLRLHWILLAVSLIVVVGAVLGSHGAALF